MHRRYGSQPPRDSARLRSPACAGLTHEQGVNRIPQSCPSPSQLQPPNLVLAICALAVLYLGFFPNHDPLFGALRALDLAGSAVAQAF